MGGETVPKGVGGDFFGDPGGFFGVLKNGLNGTFAHLGATAPVLEEKLFGPYSTCNIVRCLMLARLRMSRSTSSTLMTPCCIIRRKVDSYYR